MRQFVIKVLNIIDARCNHAVYVGIYCGIVAPEKYGLVSLSWGIIHLSQLLETE